MINDEQSVALTQARNDRGNRWLALTRDDHGTWSERIQIRGTPGEILSLQASSKRKGQGIAIYVGLHTDGGFRIKLQPQYLQKSLRSDSTLSVPFKKLKEGKGKGIRATSFTGDGSERKGLPHGEIQFFLLRDRVVAGTDSGLFRLRRESGKAWGAYSGNARIRREKSPKTSSGSRRASTDGSGSNPRSKLIGSFLNKMSITGSTAPPSKGSG